MKEQETEPLLTSNEGNIKSDEKKGKTKTVLTVSVVFCCVYWLLCCVLCIAIIVVVVILILLNLEYLMRRYTTIEFPANTTIEHAKFYTTSDNLHVLLLNGTNYEMGYAHGQLLGYLVSNAYEFIHLYMKYIVKKNYDDFKNKVLNRFNRTESFLSEEFEGFYQGAVDHHGKEMYVKCLKRNWTIEDLWFYNTIYDWDMMVKENDKGEYCSAVSISKELSYDKEPFNSRIMDFPVDLKGYVTQANLIIKYNDKVLSFSYPGYLGILTGFNKYGVWINNDNSKNGETNFNSYPPHFQPLSITNRIFLDTFSFQDDMHDFTREYFDKHHLLPSVLGMFQNRYHGFVLEIEKDVVKTRGEAEKYAVLTNHLRVVRSPIKCSRYKKYTEFLDSKSTVTPDDLLYIQRKNQLNTLYCTQFFPKDLSFRVGYMKVKGKEGWPWRIKYMGCDDDLMKKTFNFYDFY